MSNKGKKQYWTCDFYEFEYDDFGKYRLCNCDKAGIHECICEDIFQMNACPYFKKGKQSHFLEISDYEQQELEEFKMKMQKEMHDKEIEERALLKHLKEKYERQ